MAQSKPRPFRKLFWITLVLLLVGGATAAARWNKKSETTIQTSKVLKGELASVVTASGEIKPLHWVNITATAFGQIVSVHAKEGERVTKGQLIARLESIQPAADVDASRATLKAAEADVISGEANARSAQAARETAEADLARARAEAERAKNEFGRVENLVREKLVSRSEFDTARANLRVTEAAVARAHANSAQAAALGEQALSQVKRARGMVEQVRSNLARLSNVLTKHTIVAPLDGLITNLPVHAGENVVIGIQNSPGSLFGTIADMSMITAEVKVDETDIINVKLGQIAEVSIDAVPDQKFRGKVTEIGNTAILRSTGQATSLSGNASQEAKDFKVVVTLEAPPKGLRPGFSTTAKIETARKKGILTIPIQAITVRTPPQLVPQPAEGKPVIPDALKRDRTETQGVFVAKDGLVRFVKVKTGITGITDVEVDGDIKEGDEVVTGSYKVLRTIRPATRVKIDNEVDDKNDEGGA